MYVRTSGVHFVTAVHIKRCERVDRKSASQSMGKRGGNKESMLK